MIDVTQEGCTHTPKTVIPEKKKKKKKRLMREREKQPIRMNECCAHCSSLPVHPKEQIGTLVIIYLPGPLCTLVLSIGVSPLSTMNSVLVLT